MSKTVQAELTPLALRCRIEDVHPAAEKERKYLKLKLSSNLLYEQFEIFYPWHVKLHPFFESDCPVQSAKLIGSNRVFHLAIHSDNAVVLLEIDAYLASCDVGQVEAKHLPCDLLFIVQLGENRDQLLTLAKFLKETVPVIFSVAQGELPLVEEENLLQRVMDEMGKQVEANPQLLGKDTETTFHRGPRGVEIATTQKPKKSRTKK